MDWKSIIGWLEFCQPWNLIRDWSSRCCAIPTVRCRLSNAVVLNAFISGYAMM